MLCDAIPINSGLFVHAHTVADGSERLVACALMLLSSPYGQRGIFYEAWTKRDEEGWDWYEVPATECPRTSPSFLAAEERDIPGWIFRQEYMCSFEATDDQVFTTEQIEAAKSTRVHALDIGGGSLLDLLEEED